MTVRGHWIHRWDVPVGAAAPSIWNRLTPPQLFLGSFATLVLLGTLGLKTLPGLYTGEPLGWLDALFTATSAVCVTGLIVVDTATYFSTWGQAYLLLLIQLGGLGMITFTTVIILALGRRLSLRHETMAGPAIEIGERVDHRRLAYDIIRFTLALEAIGAIVLYILWVPRFGWGGAVWPAVFQAISAFCNAGFSTFTDSVMGFQSNPATLITMALLVIGGGLGFIVLEELYVRRKAWRQQRHVRMTLHTLIVLMSTGALLLGGTVLFAWFEWRGAFGGLGLVDRLTNAFFMSTTARTAGFNSIAYSLAGDDSNFLTMILMSIGGSPGSTAGGIKTTTFALIGLLAWSRLRGSEVVSLRGRSVPEETIQRSVGLFVLAFGVVTAAIFGYTHTELGGLAHGGAPFLDHMFEAVSAFNTVGLSLGVTPDLSTSGRWLTIILMYVGRVGPLVLAAALARRVGRTALVRYSYEEVVIG
ncbi:MAG TPA: TrkH family potassium uptake protein [Gemmatimonadota bacterium]|nr:TrkH family potassium uptake protein [Gemmatimonadota bacterium]